MGRSNPLRYNCERLSGDMPYSQCFNKKKRPRIEVLSKNLIGNKSFGDIDGFTEESGNFLIMEWKPAPVEIETGQRITYERATKGRSFSVITIAGDPETMIVTHRGGYVDGVWSGWKPSNLNDVQWAIGQWVKWAVAHAKIGPV